MDRQTATEAEGEDPLSREGGTPSDPGGRWKVRLEQLRIECAHRVLLLLYSTVQYSAVHCIAV
jgi:hypothetical protein